MYWTSLSSEEVEEYDYAHDATTTSNENDDDDNNSHDDDDDSSTKSNSTPSMSIAFIQYPSTGATCVHPTVSVPSMPYHAPSLTMPSVTYPPAIESFYVLRNPNYSSDYYANWRFPKERKIR